MEYYSLIIVVDRIQWSFICNRNDGFVAFDIFDDNGNNGKLINFLLSEKPIDLFGFISIDFVSNLKCKIDKCGYFVKKSKFILNFDDCRAFLLSIDRPLILGNVLYSDKGKLGTVWREYLCAS